MKIDTPKNKNYCATVVRLPEVRFSLSGLDNLEGANIFGYQVIISKDSPSQLGVFSQQNHNYRINSVLRITCIVTVT